LHSSDRHFNPVSCLLHSQEHLNHKIVENCMRAARVALHCIVSPGGATASDPPSDASYRVTPLRTTASVVPL
jgi:hypothetical protein